MGIATLFGERDIDQELRAGRLIRPRPASFCGGFHFGWLPHDVAVSVALGTAWSALTVYAGVRLPGAHNAGGGGLDISRLELASRRPQNPLGKDTDMTSATAKWVRYSARFPDFDQVVEFVRKHSIEFHEPEIEIRKTLDSVIDGRGRGQYTAKVEGFVQ